MCVVIYEYNREVESEGINMLYLAYLGESKQLKLEENILKLLIVRKPVSGIPAGFVHVPQLSPSLPLFDQAQSWKKQITRPQDIDYLRSIQKNENDSDAWWFLYANGFKKEMQSRPDMVRAIERLMEQLKQGKDIYVFCYCKDVCRCHRGLLGEGIEAKGFSVDFRKREVLDNKSSSVQQLSLFD